MQPAREDAPTHLCYGVRYAIAPDGQAFIQIPAADDKDFKGNTQSIYRGVEGAGSALRALGRTGEAAHRRGPHAGARNVRRLSLPAAYLHGAAHRGGRVAGRHSQALIAFRQAGRGSGAQQN
jgi:hypothetical protein